jgi:plasmid stability protein
MVATVRNIPDDVWKAFRIMCIEKGISANEQIVHLIESEVKKYEQEKKGGKKEAE